MTSPLCGPGRSNIRQHRFNSTRSALMPLALALAIPSLGFQPGAAISQEALSPPAEPDTTYLAGEVETPSLGMTLDQVLRLAVAHSPAAGTALADLRVAQGNRAREAGSFDPVVFGESKEVSTDSPVTSPFAGSELRQRSLTGGLSWLSPIGTSLTFSLSQLKTETNAPFTTLPRERRAGARVDFVQPLLKGFGFSATRGELRARDRELAAARRRFDGAMLGLAADVENSYWELYGAERDLAVSRLQRQGAAAFLRDQRLRGQAGVIGPGAVAAARTFLAQQEAALIVTRLRARAASDRLAQVIGLSPEEQTRIHCLDEPPPPPPLEPLGEVMKRAYAVNTDLLATQQDSAAAFARLRRAAWNAWPTLEAFGGYGGAGIAGTGQEVTIAGVTSGSFEDTPFSHAWDQVWGDDFPDWNVGLRVRVPIGWRSDRGELQVRRGNYERAREALRARRLSLEGDVRAAYRESETAQATLAAMRELVAAAREQARIGRLEYEAGRATAYDLLDLKTQQAQAELLESQAMVRVARSITNLKRLTQPATERTP